jgi:hypothetical protein
MMDGGANAATVVPVAVNSAAKRAARTIPVVVMVSMELST